jgi:hypothetical protein
MATVEEIMKRNFPEKKIQAPGKLWVFKCCNISTILPKIGKSDNVSLWRSRRAPVNRHLKGVRKLKRGGYWVCRVCLTDQSNKHRKDVLTGKSFGGLRSKFVLTLNSLRSYARKDGHKIEDVTPEYLVEMWQKQENKCAATGHPITLQRKDGAGSHLSHDHGTGKIHGFVLPRVNRAEGLLRVLTPTEIARFIKFYFPETAKVLKEN